MTEAPGATRWIAAAGAFVISLDSMVNVAFPAMAAWFDRPPEAMRSVIVAYVGTYSVMAFVGGSLADRIGLARVFRAGLALSVLAFVVAAAAPAFGWLVAGRVLQGLGGGMVYGTAPALVTLAAAPEARGRALGFFNAAIGLAFAAGPVAAGVLIQAIGWQAVFAARAPLAIGVLAWAWAGMPGGRAVAGYKMIRLGDVARRDVLVACALTFLANAGIFAIWLLAPFYLVNRRGLDPVVGALFFMLTPLGTAAAAPLGGRLADRSRPAIASVVGLALEIAGLVAMGQAGPHTPALAVAAALFTAGFGVGFFQVPNMSAIMAAFGPGQQGAAGGLAFMARTLGVVTGVLTLAAVFAARSGSAGFDAAFATAFAVAASGVGIAALVAAIDVLRAAPARVAHR